MKAEELRQLEGSELASRLKGARRELYELRFKLAVGQLENHRQILKARKDIARILTVIHQRETVEEVGSAAGVQEAPEPIAVAVAGEPGAFPADDDGDDEQAPAAPAAAETEEGGPRRSRGRAAAQEDEV